MTGVDPTCLPPKQQGGRRHQGVSPVYDDVPSNAVPARFRSSLIFSKRLRPLKDLPIALCTHLPMYVCMYAGMYVCTYVRMHP